MATRNVLLIVDMITPWDYEGADEVSIRAEEAVRAINRLRGEADGGLRIVFANDTDGFHGSRETTYALALAGRRPDLVEPLEPEPAEYFIHKGQHSAFYGTPLAHLLDVHEVGNVFLAGQVTEQCILYTALDCHVRGYRPTVVTDGVLARRTRLGNAALEMIEQNMGGRLMTSTDLARELQSARKAGMTSDS